MEIDRNGNKSMREQKSPKIQTLIFGVYVRACVCTVHEHDVINGSGSEKAGM